jgi:hypothetical protein
MRDLRQPSTNLHLPRIQADLRDVSHQPSVQSCDIPSTLTKANARLSNKLLERAEQWLEAFCSTSSDIAQQSAYGSRGPLAELSSITGASRLLNTLYSTGRPIKYYKVTFPRYQVAGLDRGSVRGWIARAALLTSPPPSDTPLYFKVLADCDARSEFKRRSNLIRLNSKVTYRAVLHELGHYLEHTIPDLHEACSQFIETFRYSDIAAPLNELVAGASFDACEQAYPGEFLHPYVGKVYSGRETEVVSMGLEQFASAEKLASFAEMFPQHCKLVLGALVSSR